MDSCSALTRKHSHENEQNAIVEISAHLLACSMSEPAYMTMAQSLEGDLFWARVGKWANTQSEKMNHYADRKILHFILSGVFLFHILQPDVLIYLVYTCINAHYCYYYMYDTSDHHMTMWLNMIGYIVHYNGNVHCNALEHSACIVSALSYKETAVIGRCYILV